MSGEELIVYCPFKKIVFHMSRKRKEYYAYVKNLSTALINLLRFF